MKNKILQWILFPIFIPADWLYLCGKEREVIQADLERWQGEIPYNHSGIAAFNYAMLVHKPFHRTFYYRTTYSLIARNISKLFLPPLMTIEIMGEIGPGLRIAHNYSVIHPEMAGRNLTVGQGVTIGKGRPDASGRENPVIGDDVTIHSNAVVFGGIRIGDHVTVGAGAVVFQDVPDHCTVVGNPGRIIRKS